MRIFYVVNNKGYLVLFRFMVMKKSAGELQNKKAIIILQFITFY